MLTSYQTQTQNLLHDPNATLYPVASLTLWINEGRRQLAMESQSVRAIAAGTVTGSNTVTFATLSASPPTGVNTLLDIRKLWPTTTTNPTINVRTWDWYVQYYAAATLATTAPTEWMQYADGVNGVVYFNTSPAATFNFSVDGVWLPVDLVSDVTVEALPVPWQDAVKYYAAYLAYANAQRAADANLMLELFKAFVARARLMSRPTAVPQDFPRDWSAGSMPEAMPMPQGGQGG